MIFQYSRPFRILFKLPLNLVPATALKALARFQVLLADLFTSSESTLSAEALSSVRLEGLLFLSLVRQWW